ncbi:MAG: glycosyl hydrolase [Phycisphaerae bacterium]
MANESDYMQSALGAGLGFPSRDRDLDVMSGFSNPPAGYGEVPFWWWTGDALDAPRLIEQIRELHAKGVSGVQVNYSHYDTPNDWLTEQDEPAIFSQEWWEVYAQVSAACAKLDMGIGMSTYTVDWPGPKNLFYHLFYSKPELNAFEHDAGPTRRLSGGESVTIDCAADQFAARAYPVVDGQLQRGGVDLAPYIKDGKLTWTAPQGQWDVRTFRSLRKAGTLNPMMAGAGKTVIAGFFQKFQDHNAGSSKGLNYFFNDELHVGMGKFAWNGDFAAEFSRRKGYDLFDVLPAMWEDIGPLTPKVRMDYADVRMSLMEERYFRPIFHWHASRGMIFACDSGGRGRHPNEFGDYFRATRWYTAPGHDTPGGKADLIKGKVSSSIANLYQRPRVWLEGYHSLGWGAAPELLMHATRENYLYGCTLLNLHGLYFTTYGSHWEWAPPCYHFRMPYWAHMGVFLKYFERLSYVMSQGCLAADVAVVYPVAPYEAEMDADAARDTAFELAHKLIAAGINFEFIDNDSLARAVVEDGRLIVKDAGASYQALVLPNMKAVRWATIEKAAAFAAGGGKVYCVGALPMASDRAGRDDAELERMNALAFSPQCRLTDAAAAVEAIRGAFVQDVRGLSQTVRAIHRKIGPRDVYMVLDAQPGSIVEFRAKGAAELLDPWTGAATPLRVVAETATGTQVELPLEPYEAQVVAFTPGKKHVNPPAKDARPEAAKLLPRTWTVEFAATMDNTHGDFRIPVTSDNKMIGVEARRFAWAQETEELAKTAMLPQTDDSSWARNLHGFGSQFYVLGPVPADVDAAQLDAKLAAITTVDPLVPVTISGKSLSWRPYDFSWRYGKEEDLGHQGYHGLKRTVTDDFICLGKQVDGLNETRHEGDGGRYYLWTSATVAKATMAEIRVSRGAPADKSHTSPVITPAAVYVNGSAVNLSQPVELSAGANPVVVRYDAGGRGHFVMRDQAIAAPNARQKLAMRWYDDAGLIRFDVTAGQQKAQWLRFLSAPGTASIRVQALGSVTAWMDGRPMLAKGNGRFVPGRPCPHAAVIALRIKSETGCIGGAAVPEPVTIQTDGRGEMPLGDWSKMGVLNNYSGGVRYSTQVTLSADETAGSLTLDLGHVAGTAEVHVNGASAGVRVAPPWKVDATGLFKAGENTVEVLVYNTLANHYQTIPSRYRGEPVSGLMGPVRLLLRR